MFKAVTALFLGVLVMAILAVLASYIAGCNKQQLEPKWPAPRVIYTCKLPAGPKLPKVTRDEVDCPDHLVCFDLENAAKLAVREQRMKLWIKEVKLRCAPPSDAGVPDASSADLQTR